MSTTYEVETDTIRVLQDEIPRRVSVRLYKVTSSEISRGSTTTFSTMRTLVQSWLLPVEVAS